MKVSAIPLPGGDRGTEITVQKMRGLIEQGKKDPVVHELAAWILHRYKVPAFDWSGEARAIGEAVWRNVRFTRDVTHKETLHSAAEIIRLKIGDCDDFSILICSLLESIGAETRLVTVSNHREDPSQFSHIYPEVKIEGKWVPVDFARRFPSFGKGPEHFYRKRVWDVDSDAYTDVQGLRGFGAMRLGYNPYALPGAYRVNQNPQFQRLRATPFLGQGRYGLRGLRSLGDDSFDWSTVTNAITGATTGAANIIAAERASPYNLVPTTSTAVAARSPYGVPVTPAVVPGSIAGISSSTLLLLLGAGAIALFAAGEKK
jgi:hypothetical protein